MICSTSSRRKPGLRFTAGSTSCLESNTEPRWLGVTLAPRRFMIMVDIFMFLVILYFMSYWFGTLEPFISYWSLISCEYQLWWSSKPRLTNQRVSSRKCWKNDEILEFRRKFFSKTPGSGNLHLRMSPWRKFRERISNEVICSTSSRRKPGWRFTAGSTS